MDVESREQSVQSVSGCLVTCPAVRRQVDADGFVLYAALAVFCMSVAPKKSISWERERLRECERKESEIFPSDGMMQPQNK